MKSNLKNLVKSCLTATLLAGGISSCGYKEITPEEQAEISRNELIFREVTQRVVELKRDIARQTELLDGKSGISFQDMADLSNYTGCPWTFQEGDRIDVIWKAGQIPRGSNSWVRLGYSQAGVIGTIFDDSSGRNYSRVHDIGLAEAEDILKKLTQRNEGKEKNSQ